MIDTLTGIHLSNRHAHPFLLYRSSSSMTEKKLSDDPENKTAIADSVSRFYP